MSDAIISFRAAMAVAWGMLQEGIISEEEYCQIEATIASNKGVDLSTLCCRNPLIFRGFRANMSLPNSKGGGINA